MDPVQVEQRIVEIIANETGVMEEEVQSILESNGRFSQLPTDSLNKLEVISDIENEFGISMNDEKVLDKDCTIRELIDYAKACLYMDTPPIAHA